MTRDGRVRESQAARRRRINRDAPDPPEDPCTCRASCPFCDLRCLGGHAYYPQSHWCVELHQWHA